MHNIHPITHSQSVTTFHIIYCHQIYKRCLYIYMTICIQYVHFISNNNFQKLIITLLKYNLLVMNFHVLGIKYFSKQHINKLNRTVTNR